MDNTQSRVLNVIATIQGLNHTVAEATCDWVTKTKIDM